MSRKRTKIENIPQPNRDLTEEEEKAIRGGVLPQTGSGGGGATGATRLSTVVTHVHEGGHTGEDREFDADQNE